MTHNLKTDDDIEALIWLGVDDMGDIRKGDTLRVCTDDLIVEGVADEKTAHGGWGTAKKRMLISPHDDLTFVILERSTPIYAPWTVVRVSEPATISRTLLVHPDGSWRDAVDGTTIWDFGPPDLTNYTTEVLSHPGES